MHEQGRVEGGARIPGSTYRLQLNHRFTFADAAAIVDYLDALGVTDCYASPFLKARPGSLHGYDVSDPTRLNPEIGGAAEFADFAGRLRARGMGLIMDVVPNHMCISDPANRWWQDVLENGPSSPYAGYFDINWRPLKAHLADKVLLPVLGGQYGRVLENGQLQVRYEDGAFTLHYDESRFPVAPRTLAAVLEPALASLRTRYAEEAPLVLELESIITAIGHLPLRSETDHAKVRERQREKEVIKRRLATLVGQNPDVGAAIDVALAEVNGTPGAPASFDRLEALLEEQAYRLSDWRVASDEINYRRFFDVNELAAICVERRRVFVAVHKLVRRLVEQGWVTGLRIDHVDGLFDPAGYLRALQRFVGADGGADRGAAGGARTYIVVEKILGKGERLPAEWPVHGTTGYDFMQCLDGVFVDPSSADGIRAFYRALTGRDERFEDVLVTAKKLIMLISLAAELHVLAWQLDRISEQHRWSRDFTRESLRFGLREVIACFPVYRSYVRRGDTEVAPDDRRHVELAIREAKRRNPTTDPSLFDFIGSVLLLDDPDGLTDVQRAERRRFVLRLQQLTGPVMAKALEDTAFYRWFPLASLNEVGGDPRVFGVGVEEFHRRNEERRRTWPHALSATATHDTKRGEDVRARISALSEIPDAWCDAVTRWRALNAGARRDAEGVTVPDANEEYLFYQTLIGAWPFAMHGGDAETAFRDRITGYMRKALKEAKLHTSWINPHREYEDAMTTFIEAVLASAAFRDDFARFQAPIARAAVATGLARTVLKIAAPGVPDFYRGTELWDLSLVDPDNRRPVDYVSRRAMLDDLDARAGRDRRALVRELLAKPADGAIKLYVAASALRFRREHRELFDDGAYVPLVALGERAPHVVAFARVAGERAVVAVAGRFFLRLAEAAARDGDDPAGGERGGGAQSAAARWRGTRLALDPRLPRGEYRDVLTGCGVTVGDEPIAVDGVLADLPCALLARV